MSRVPHSQCANCGREWPDDELDPIKDLLQRVAPGECFPSGECPDCGCLCHPSDDREPSDAELEAARERVPYEQTDAYRDSMIDAGRGHLLR